MAGNYPCLTCHADHRCTACWRVSTRLTSTVPVPEPDLVDKEAVLAAIPIGEKSIEVVMGGLRTPGLEVACFSPGCSDIVLACAALTVSVDID